MSDDMEVEKGDGKMSAVTEAWGKLQDFICDETRSSSCGQTVYSYGGER